MPLQGVKVSIRPLLNRDTRYPRRLVGLAILGSFATAAALVSLAPVALADDFTLKDGRKITGNVVSKRPEGTLVVELSAGNMMLLNQSEIKLHQESSKGESAYVEALKSASDTIESHLEMVNVARKNQLLDHERAHYERILELDPEHVVARRALGYHKNEKDGRWVSRDDEMREGRGKVAVGGKYRFPELIAMEEAEKKFIAQRSQLINEIKRAVSNLSNPRNSAKAQATLDALEGPIASAAIAQYLYPRANGLGKTTMTPATKALFIPILKRLGDGVAIQTLITICLDTDTSADQVAVRQQALEVLKKLAPQDAFHQFMGALNKKETINLAGQLLQEIGDERSILPLIDRLVSVERKEFGGGQATNVSMGDGGTGFSKGDPKIVRNINVENPGVLGALVSITNQNFNYDKASWLQWYEQNYVAFRGDLRRDP